MMILFDGIRHASLFLQVLQFDHWLFTKINRQWTNLFFDHSLPYLRETSIWIPFYLFLLVFTTMNFGKRGWQWCLGLMMTGVISDLASNHLVKQWIFRYRPCQDPSMAEQVRMIANYCPPNSSFVSAAACNYFAAAIFIYFTLRDLSGLWWLVFLWAFAVAYAQIYVGVHYPLDILGGTILGCGIGYGMQSFFQFQVGKLSLKQ